MGLFTGLVGAGGGFLFIPILVTLVGLSMKQAVGTSLLVIAINSLVGFLGELNGSHEIDWIFLGIFFAFNLVGVILGSWLTRFIPGARLKPAFGWFVLIMGCFILYQSMQTLSV